MADADEDALLSLSAPLPGVQSSSNISNNESNSPIDLDDEDGAVDFRFLTSNTRGGALPKRGEKEFEPLSLSSQRSQLDASRLAFHNALSTTRVHTAGKGHNVGMYVTDRERQKDPRLKTHFDNELENERVVVVPKFVGVHNRTVGRMDARGWTWLTPEEALFMLERGNLDIRWGDADHDTVVHSEAHEEEADEKVDKDFAIPELPMSLQGAYATFIGKSGLTLDRYLVYSSLKRSGYVVMRTGQWKEDNSDVENSLPKSPTQSFSTPSTEPTSTISQPAPSLIHRLINYLINPNLGISSPSHGPLLAPGLYRNYNSVFRSIALIPFHTSTPPSLHSSTTNLPPQSPFKTCYLVYKPSPTFAKAHPPPPSYHISVVDARTTFIPTLSEIASLLDSMPDQEQPSNHATMRIEAKIKHGTRSALVAVVDQGVIGWLRFGEAESGRYKLYEDKAVRKGGGGKGRGQAKGGRGSGGKRKT